jgi:hypothetical protein
LEEGTSLDSIATNDELATTGNDGTSVRVGANEPSAVEDEKEPVVSTVVCGDEKEPVVSTAVCGDETGTVDEVSTLVVVQEEEETVGFDEVATVFVEDIVAVNDTTAVEPRTVCDKEIAEVDGEMAAVILVTEDDIALKDGL